MRNPEVVVGEKVFSPKRMSVLREFATKVGLAIYDFVIDITSPFYEYRRLMDGATLRLFYGKEAEAAFKNLPGVTEPPRRGLNFYRYELLHPTLGKDNGYVWYHEDRTDRDVIMPMTIEPILPKP